MICVIELMFLILYGCKVAVLLQFSLIMQTHPFAVQDWLSKTTGSNNLSDSMGAASLLSQPSLL